MVRQTDAEEIALAARVRQAFGWDSPGLLDEDEAMFDCQAALTLWECLERLKRNVNAASRKRKQQAVREAEAILAERYWFARQDSSPDHRDRPADELGRPCSYGVWLIGMAWMRDVADGVATLPKKLPVAAAGVLQSDGERLYGIAIGERDDDELV